MEALKKSLAEKQAPPAAAARTRWRVGKKPPARGGGSRCNGAEEGKEGRRLSFRPHHLMGPTDRFSPDEVQRILGLTEKQLDYWERLRLVSPRKEKGNRYYDFGDLIGLRTVKQLVENGVPANRLRRSLAALREKLGAREGSALGAAGALRRRSGDRRTRRNAAGAVVRPVRAEFRDSRMNESVRVMTGRSADEWLAVALEYEAEGNNRAQAIDAYERAFCVTRRGPTR